MLLPVIILLGLVLGRWSFAPVAGGAWALYLLIDGTCDVWCFPAAFMVATVNAALGVLVHKALATLVRFATRSARPS